MHYFLDLDNTVTESRSRIDADMFRALYPLDVVIISGASHKQMEAQLGELPCTIMSQNGNINPLWQRTLTDEEYIEINEHILEYANPLENQLEDRGAQISYSFIGHHAPLNIKKAYDPGGLKRHAILESNPLPEDALVEARIGGTTCIDYFPKGLNKGYNVRRFIKEKGWNPRDCVYIGDALFPGGNDETVIGVIPTFPVNSPKDTLDFLT